ncbi:hypothetical protein PV327_010598 [Microctonus hyperodae]|uniref:phospholipase A1 n=1 Tax=Microctonus hyperodae TaxID=165561 RepID=A0AA39KV95_MICHY|nr:hypothetical protein PV327_010598 [Microctonus hyperodae]
MVLPLLIAGALIYCNVVIPNDMRSEIYYDPYSCDTCPDINKDIQFHLYTRKNPNISHALHPNNDSTFINSPFNPKHKTVIIVHGFTGDAKTHSSQSSKNALLQKGEYNAILVDWGNLSGAPDYCKVITRMPVTGTYVAQLIMSLENIFSISRSTFHVIGFSLGAHISGLTGEALARNDPKKIKIGRITGLDPAGPGFEASNGLDKTDATFVDIIHTNTIKYGIEKSIGHVDFYVNYGFRQPGCYLHEVGCSHMRAWKIFAESVSTPYAFPAFRCGPAGKWRKTKLLMGRLSRPQSNCRNFEGDYMGIIAKPKSEGIFTVFTNDHPPYGNSWGITPSNTVEESDEAVCDNSNIDYDNNENDTFSDEDSNEDNEIPSDITDEHAEHKQMEMNNNMSNNISVSLI